MVGVDLSVELLKIAKREEQCDPLGITYLQEDGQHLHGLADATFDGVVCSLALMDMDNLSSLHRQVEKGNQPVISSSSLSHVNGSVPFHGCFRVGERKYGAQGSDPATRRVCVFAGSGLGSRRVYQQATRELGKELA